MDQDIFVERKEISSFHEQIQIFREETDLIQVRKLIHKTIETCYSACYDNEVVRFFLDYNDYHTIRERAANGITLVYSINRKIVGTGTLKGNQIEALFIDPLMQHKGIGKKILCSLYNEAQKQQLKKLGIAATVGSKNFFQNQGFLQISENTEWLDNQLSFVFFLMEKPVRQTIAI